MELFDLTGRRALITGSTQGIGFALADGLGRAGASVLLNGRDSARLSGAVARLTERGIATDGALFDVTNPTAVECGIADGGTMLRRRNSTRSILSSRAAASTRRSTR